LIVESNHDSADGLMVPDPVALQRSENR